MKKFSFALSVVVLGSSFSVFAQSSTQTEYLRKARIQLEVENQNKLLEMIENQRLEEERQRMQRIEGLSFSVQNQASTQPQQPTYAPIYQPEEPASF